MLIIDEYADNKLLAKLEAITLQGQVVKCAHFRFSGIPVKTTAEDPRRRVISAAKDAFSFTVAEVYLCDDGDIFLLAATSCDKHIRRVIADTAGVLHELSEEDIVDYFDLPENIGALLKRLKVKSEKRQEAGEAIKEKSEQEQLEQKRRQLVHHYLLQRNLVDIASRRDARQQVEIMIIENDAFSRKLVENILQGQYSLTSINNPEQALFTYANCAPDVLFVDINLPSINTQDLMERITALDPEAYIILFSANSNPKNIENALLLGAKGFIDHPFTGPKLFEHIDHCPTIRKGNYSVH